MRVLEPITAFHKNKERRYEIYKPFISFLQA